MRNFLSIPVLIFCTLNAFAQSGGNAAAGWFRPLKQCWKYASSDISGVAVASDNDKTIVLPINDGSLLALDSSSGKTVWIRKTKIVLSSKLLINPGTLFFVTTTNENLGNETPRSSLEAVDMRSGLNNWTRPLKRRQPAKGVAEILGAGPKFYMGFRDGAISGVNKSTGEMIWQSSLGSSLSTSLYESDKSIVAGTTNKTVVSVSKASGAVVNQIPVGQIPTALLVNHQKLLIGDRLGTIRAVSYPDGKLLWKFRTGGEIVRFLRYPKGVLALSKDNFVYSLTPDGSRNWRTKLSGRILGATIVSDRLGFFLSSGSNEAVIIDLKNGDYVNRIEPEGADYFVSSPISIANMVIVPTNTGIFAYGPTCGDSRPNP